ncbi:MAG TPA: c-type cytochrome domain-containing protein, partial [Tepidisphaeraceae bacterium]|nr:c-type cytochrome domain-containing protein [Tepidisphaeraceae bacterium]
MSHLRAVFVLAIFLGSIPTLARAGGRLTYNRDIRPILSDNCFACHGPDKNKRKAKLRLDERDSALEKKVFVPGHSDQSELVKRIFSSDSKEMMPPPESHKRLTEAQKQTLRRWVQEGAEY